MVSLKNNQIKSFLKEYPDYEQFLESLKNAQEAYSISQKTAIFTTPSVLYYDEEKCLISYEFIKDAITVRKLLRSYNYLKLTKKQLVDLFYNTGFALAEYHRHSKKLHGDFQPNNVMFEPGNTNRIYFIDFSRSELSDDPNYNHGSILRDLALFAIHIKIKYPFYLFPMAFRKFNDLLCHEMFKGYMEFSKVIIEHDQLLDEVEDLKQEFYKNTFMFKFFGWSRFLKIKGYKNEDE